MKEGELAGPGVIAGTATLASAGVGPRRHDFAKGAQDPVAEGIGLPFPNNSDFRERPRGIEGNDARGRTPVSPRRAGAARPPVRNGRSRARRRPAAALSAGPCPCRGPIGVELHLRSLWLAHRAGRHPDVRGRSVKVDASFIDIVEKSDTLVALMGTFVARKGPFSVYSDVVWSKVGVGQQRRDPHAAPGISGTVGPPSGSTSRWPSSRSAPPTRWRAPAPSRSIFSVACGTGTRRRMSRSTSSAPSNRRSRAHRRPRHCALRLGRLGRPRLRRAAALHRGTRARTVPARRRGRVRPRQRFLLAGHWRIRLRLRRLAGHHVPGSSATAPFTSTMRRASAACATSSTCSSTGRCLASACGSNSVRDRGAPRSPC